MDEKEHHGKPMIFCEGREYETWAGAGHSFDTTDSLAVCACGCGWWEDRDRIGPCGWSGQRTKYRAEIQK